MSRGTRDVKSLVERQHQQRVTAANDSNRQADHLVGLLKNKVAQQAHELDDRTESINAIQRNFERLSKIYSGEKTEIEQLREKLKAAEAEIEDLKAQLKLNGVVRIDYQRVTDEYAQFKTATEERLAGLIAERDALLLQLSKAEHDVAVLQEEHAGMISEKAAALETLSTLQSEHAQLLDVNEDLQASIRDLLAQLSTQGDELEGVRKALADAQGRTKEAESKTHEATFHNRKLQDELKEVKGELAHARKALAALESQLKEKDAMFQELRDDWGKGESGFAEQREAWKHAELSLRATLELTNLQLAESQARAILSHASFAEVDAAMQQHHCELTGCYERILAAKDQELGTFQQALNDLKASGERALGTKAREGQERTAALHREIHTTRNERDRALAQFRNAQEEISALEAQRKDCEVVELRL
eukprot:NODE_449_length_2465_cov_108.120837_g426_i0.p1 GENE.NODE_449_length_2465_cov_108.120837_g426_i0~~NODE_449_length_2465_cov_108.120837_g426_i0.p1  ORF type:complete len:422 (+),score=96.72 NODE_449_length_2465_cov_108.120837_g426_i0:130-1395(+)